eukprot:scaffold7040_cov45-Isochrysis_galbana.AAC.1
MLATRACPRLHTAHTHAHTQPYPPSSFFQVFGAIRAEIVRFEGMLARFNVDDKGTILFAAFGPPPYQHEDDAVRAVLCALQ